MIRLRQPVFLMATSEAVTCRNWPKVVLRWLAEMTVRCRGSVLRIVAIEHAPDFSAAVVEKPVTLSAIDYAIVGAYLLGMLALGAVVSTRIKGFKDYFLAGGALTTPLLVCTLVSSYYGIDVTFGTSETGFYYGVVAWFWYSLPYYFFIALAALVIAPRLRRYGDAMTLSDVLEHHYGTKTRVVGAAACFIYSAPVLAMGGHDDADELPGLLADVGLAGDDRRVRGLHDHGRHVGRRAQRHRAVRADVRVAGDCDSVCRRLGRRLGVRRASARAARRRRIATYAASRGPEHLDARRVVAHRAHGAYRAGVLSASVRGPGQRRACSGRC